MLQSALGASPGEEFLLICVRRIAKQFGVLIDSNAMLLS